MPRITPEAAPGGLQMCAFLDMISISEGTSNSPITQDDGYDIIVSSVGPDGKLQRNRFDDYSDHPFMPQFGRKSLTINSKGLTSNASGRGQIMLKDWPHYKALLGLPDFSPLSQDRYCIQIIRERGAIPYLIAGNFDKALSLCGNLWASLPNNNYGQFQHSYDTLKSAFLLNGGTVA
jgi:muramidase (phage lysozyme)